MLDPRFTDALERLPDYLGSHVQVSVTAMLIGLIVSLPLAIFSVRRPALRNALLGAASVVQTIPGIALLTLFYPLLLALAALSERALGKGFSALGFLPAVLALALYSMLPILRNTVTGLLAVKDDLRDAGRALALGPWQILRHVELPLAMPMIMAGIRISAVWVIGTATLSTPIGQASLGNYIFAGLQTQNWVFVLFGCVAAAVLALVVDQLLGVMERGVASHSRASVIAGGAGLVLLVLAAFLPGYAGSRTTYVIGAKPFAEQYVLASLIQQRLEANGFSASQRPGLGSSIAFDALSSGDIDAYVDYSGTIWANQMHHNEVKPRREVMDEVGQWLKRERNITMLGGLGFENAYALAMSRNKANELGIRSIADLAAHGPQLTVAGDYEFFSRPEWRALRDSYGLNFRSQRTMQAEFMYPAAGNGDVDVISAYSSDGQIAQYDLVVLDDPKQAIPPYDAILLVSPKRANDAGFRAAVAPLIDAIDVTAMREANLRAATGGAQGSPAEVAKWLWEKVRNK
jgi:glycine betaine/choline ABC-type transport system substrate-binding protein/ABC-type proline/glycine betaine transport system permease subunit